MKYSIYEIKKMLKFNDLDLSKLLGIHVNSVRNKINRKTSWKIEELQIIADYAKIGIEQIKV